MKKFQRFIAGLAVSCLVLLAIHDLAHAKERPGTPCQVCTMALRATPHAPKARPAVVSRQRWLPFRAQIFAAIVPAHAVSAPARDPPAA
ncbi:MAG: hypothetical protein ACYCPQ_08720 [Elusimicrobiota bacterium]